VIVDFRVGQVALLQTLGDELFDFRLLLVSFISHADRRGLQEPISIVI
jgi:hypothetical protein